jgi:hypothetical protein
MKYFLIWNESDEMRQPPINISDLEALESDDEPGAQSPAHDDSVRSAGHSGFPSWVAIDSWGSVTDGLCGEGSRQARPSVRDSLVCGEEVHHRAPGPGGSSRSEPPTV